MVAMSDRSTDELAHRLDAMATSQRTESDTALVFAASRRLTQLSTAPHLGLASTEQLLDELRARIDIDFKTGIPGGLDYSTVGGTPEPGPGGVRARVTPPFVVEVHVK